MSPQPLPQIRLALPADFPDLQAMMLALYAADVVGEGMTLAKAERTLGHLRRHPDRGCVVVFQQRGRLAGYAIVIWFWSNEYGGPIAVIDELWVEPWARGQGLASGLLQWLPAQWPQTVAVDLEVSPENGAARGWYLRRGFRPQRNLMLRLTLESTDE